MVQLPTFFSSLVLISVVLAGPVVQIRDNMIALPFTTRVTNQTSSGLNFADSERARARRLIENGRRVQQGSQLGARQATFDIADTYVSDSQMRVVVAVDGFD